MIIDLNRINFVFKMLFNNIFLNSIKKYLFFEISLEHIFMEQQSKKN